MLADTQNDNASPAPLEGALTAEQFCERFGLSRSTFYKMQRDGYAPATMKVGRRTLISLQAVKSWRENMEFRARPPASSGEQFVAVSEHSLAALRLDLAQLTMMRVAVREALGSDTLHAFGVGELADVYAGLIARAVAEIERCVDQHRLTGKIDLDGVAFAQLNERLGEARRSYEAAVGRLCAFAAATGSEVRQ